MKKDRKSIFSAAGVVLVCIFAASFLAACPNPVNGQPDAPKYSITVPGKTSGGTVTADAEKAQAGTTVTLVVSPAQGYEFESLNVGSAGGGSVPAAAGSGGVWTFTMPAGDVTVTAVFVLESAPSYDIIIDENISGGTVTADQAAAAAGTGVILTVTPDSGKEFGSLTVTAEDDTRIETGESGENPCAFIMPAQKVTVTAVFIDADAPRYDITVTPPANGTVTSGLQKAAAGVEVALTVTPDTGYKLADNGLSVTGSGTVAVTQVGASYCFIMPNAAVTVTAVFEIIPMYDITITPPEHGSVATDPASKAAEGSDVVVTLTAEAGYRYKSGSLAIISGANPLTPVPVSGEAGKWMFTMPGAAVTVAAEFEDSSAPLTMYDITITPPEHGSVATDPASKAAEGSDVVVTLTAEAGYRYKSGSLAISSGANPLMPVPVSGEAGKWKFTMPGAAVTVTAEFEDSPAPLTVYNITITAPEHGSVATDPASKAAEGSDVIVTLTAETGYRYKSGSLAIVSGANSLTPAPASGEAGKWKFVMPSGNVTISAQFNAEPAAPGNADPKFHIYIGFGQSNFEAANGQAWDAQTNYPWTDQRFQVFNPFETTGYGVQPYGREKEKWYPAQPPLISGDTGLTPADGFGRYLAERLADTDIKIGVIPIGIRGASLDTWAPDTGGNNWVKNSSDQDALLYRRYDPDGKIFERMAELAKMAQEAGVIKGIIIHQGEGGGGFNSGDGGWDKLLKRIYDRLLQELGLEANSIPLLAGEPKSTGGWASNSAGSYYIPNLDTDYPGIFYSIKAMDLATVDGIHFTNAAQMTLGRRYGEKMLDLVYGGYALNPNITVTQPAGGSFTVKVGSAAPVQGNTSAKAGTEVVLEAAPGSGNVFSSFDITGAALEADYTNINIRRFIMPAGAHVTVTAVFVPEGSNRINTKVTPQFRGTISLNPDITMAAQGRQIIITAATAGNVGNIYSPAVKVEGASGNDITGAVLTGAGPWTLTMPNEEITVTAVFVQDVATLESQNILHGTNNSGFRNDASSSAFSVMHNQEYEFEIQYKTAGTAGRPIAITVIPGNEDWPAGNSGFSSVSPYNGSHGRVETFLGTTMVILDNTGGEWVTERFTFKAAGDFISKGSWGDGSTAGVYIGINPENTAGAEGWVNYVCLRRMTGDNPPSVNVLGNSRFKNGLANWSHYKSTTNAGIVTMNAPRVPVYAIKD